MSKGIQDYVNQLPEKSYTVRMLQALDWVVPGQWQNVVGFENTIKVVTGETDQALIQQIGERAIKLYNDRSQGYQRALWLYQTVDSTQGLAGTAAMANLVGEKVTFLSFLSKITPKSEKIQVIDLSVKLVVEVVAFCLINGIPGDSIGDFVKSLASYGNESIMRMAALASVDGVLPLGPEFMSKALSLLQNTGATELASNPKFKSVASLIPGKDPQGQLSFVQESMSSVKDWMVKFVADKAITVDKVATSMKGWVDWSEGKLDLLAAAIDMTCNYYEHTGIQTLARRLIQRAVAEI